MALLGKESWGGTEYRCACGLCANVVSWALEVGGCRALVALRDATGELELGWWAQWASVRGWLTERCERREGAYCRTAVAVEDYRRWLRRADIGVRHTRWGAERCLSEQLRVRGYQVTADPISCIQGLTLARRAPRCYERSSPVSGSQRPLPAPHSPAGAG